MKLVKLNKAGFSHDILLVFVVVLIAIIGVGYAVASHADQVAQNSSVDNTAGTVVVWGDNEHGELGQGDNSHVQTAIEVKNLTNVSSIAAGGSANLALLNNGTAEVWGGNQWGELAQGNSTQSSTPELVPKINGLITEVSSARDHSMVLTNNGSVYTWGGNLWGTWGNGTIGPDAGSGGNCLNCADFSAYQIKNLSNVVQISAGGTDDMVLLKNGTVMAWGDNTLGELGVNPVNYTNNYLPTVIPGLSGVKQLAAGEGDDYALLNNGTVMAWGDNEEGQLGNGTISKYDFVPTVIPGLNNVKAISTSGLSTHNMALLNNGTVMAWGDDSKGELGVGSKSQTCKHTAANSVSFQCSTTPIQIPGLSNVSAVAAGYQFSLALSHGNVYAMGDNTYGQLGNGTRVSSTTPVQVLGVSGATAIAASNDDGLALE